VQIKGIIYTFLIKSFHTSKSNNIKRLNKEERTKFNLDEFLKQVLIGNLLGDIYMRRSSDRALVQQFLDKVLQMQIIYYIYIVYFNNLYKLLLQLQ
jgi:hypothetical protein